MAKPTKNRLDGRPGDADATTIVAPDVLENLGGKLVYRDGDGKRRTADVGDEPVRIGRIAPCELVLDDQRASALHAELIATERGVRIRDLGSRNGTWVSGVRISEAFLTQQCQIRAGRSLVRFEPSEPARVKVADRESLGPLFGTSLAMRMVFEQLERVARTDLTVLLQGETGTGKELAAQAIHELSERSGGPFVVIDCGAIPPTLADSMLFGHEKGAYTGAVGTRESPFVEARGGTVFLDELGELPMDVQPKLLRGLAQRRIMPVGGSRYVPIEVRLVAATRRDLARAVNAGRFRSDLYFRVAQLCVTMPPLRDRPEDIPGLVQALLAQLGDEKAYDRVSSPSLERLMQYDWPGNVRELSNAAAVALAMTSADEPLDIARFVRRGAPSEEQGPTLRSAPDYHAAKREALNSFEREYFARLCHAANGNVSEVARRAGLQRAHVRRYLRKHGIGRSDP